MVTFQHSPINVRPSENVERLEKSVMVIPGKRLGENVSNVVARRNLFEDDQIGLNELAEVMVASVVF